MLPDVVTQTAHAHFTEPFVICNLLSLRSKPLHSIHCRSDTILLLHYGKWFVPRVMYLMTSCFFRALLTGFLFLASRWKGEAFNLLSYNSGPLNDLSLLLPQSQVSEGRYLDSFGRISRLFREYAHFIRASCWH